MTAERRSDDSQQTAKPRNAIVLQNLMQRYPVDSSSLHHNRLDSAGLQPLRHTVQICSEAPECSHWFGISLCGYCYIMFGIAHVDTGGIPIQFRKAILEIFVLPLFLFLLLILRHRM